MENSDEGTQKLHKDAEKDTGSLIEDGDCKEGRPKGSGKDEKRLPRRDPVCIFPKSREKTVRLPQFLPKTFCTPIALSRYFSLRSVVLTYL